MGRAMIITQTHKHRTFVGSINPGTDLVEGVKNICVDNSIFCGAFSAVGYLSNVSVQTFDVELKRHRDSRTHKGTFHAVSIQGNISLEERQTSIQCHIVGTVDDASGNPKLVSGELVTGEVVAVEFVLQTHDDIQLFRAADERTGMMPWLHVEFGGGKPVARESSVVPTAESAAPRTRPVAVAPAVTPRARVKTSAEPHELDIRPGDSLNHPTLGRCEVLGGDVETEERLTIKLESGRVVELHLGLLELTPVPTEDGTRIFKVSIRRRR
ncbi:MAG: putative DNA-binding protein with PD1-like motif [Myxococcota bacterium]|jgi:predicted DNA-binding protein with PD1-like motif